MRDDVVDVQRFGKGLAHLDVVERWLARVEQQGVHQAVHTGDDLGVLRLLDAIDIGNRHALDDIHLALQQRVHTRSVFGNERVASAGRIRLLAPVAGVALERQRGAPAPFGQLVRAGAHWLVIDFLLAV
ncbi:hypothetical protein D3C72_1774380 [compost metagenome]